VSIDLQVCIIAQTPFGNNTVIELLLEAPLLLVLILRYID